MLSTDTASWYDHQPHNAWLQNYDLALVSRFSKSMLTVCWMSSA